MNYLTVEFCMWNTPRNRILSFLIKYLVRKVIFLNRIWRIPRKSFLSDLPIFGHEMNHFLPFLFDIDESTLAVFLSLLFQENSLKIFFFKKSMFVAFLYIALILGFSQSIVSRAWGDRFRPLVHPLESEVGPHRGPLHQPQDHSRVEKKSTHQHQPTAKILFYPIFDIRTYSIISLYYTSLL